MKYNIILYNMLFIFKKRFSQQMTPIDLFLLKHIRVLKIIFYLIFLVHFLLHGVSLPVNNFLPFFCIFFFLVSLLKKYACLLLYYSVITKYVVTDLLFLNYYLKNLNLKSCFSLAHPV